MSTEPLRLAIVGCGAVARRCHLPALAGDSPFELVALVDLELGNAVDAAQAYRRVGGATDAVHVMTDLAQILPHIDAAVIATAATAHAAVAATVLRAGRHVLVEKPLAVSVAECDEIRAARAVGGALVVPGHVRRVYRSASWVRDALSTGRLGEIRSVRWSQGRIFAWPLVSGSSVDLTRHGAGVLEDLGPHALDMLRLWFGEPLEVTRFAHNGDGESASEAIVELTLAGVPAELHLSWLRALDNRCVIEGEHRTLSVGLGRGADYVEYLTGERPAVDGHVEAPQDSVQTIFRRQLVGFAHAIAGLDNELATFDDGVATVRLIESCRALPREQLSQPWRARSRGSAIAAPGRVAVTGATGFIGANVVERLTTSATEVVVIARSFAKLARLTHLDGSRVSCTLADVRDADALGGAFAGCETVVHTAYGSDGELDERWSVTVDGTAAALAAAARCGVSRFVHVSSMAVYDLRGATMLDETCSLIEPVAGDRSYAQQKLAAERLAIDARSAAMEVVALQPTIVYGPWGPNWTHKPLQRLVAGDDDLPSGPGGGVCNPVHVHDVADAIAFLVVAAGVDGRVLVTGPDDLPWGRYYDAYRDLAGVAHRASYDWDGAPALFRSKTTVDAARLRSLGFTPRIGFAEGIGGVAGWARWAGIVGAA